MDILLWLLLGLIAGWLASIVMKTNSQQGSLTDIILGIWCFCWRIPYSFQTGVTGFNIYSILVAIRCSCIWLGRMLRHSA
jgi:uncharacterized membrane protein YeaQ/YmgE (transglycosylase-associated protein family)